MKKTPKKDKPTDPKPKNMDSNESTLKKVTDRFELARNFRALEQEDIWKRSYNNWRGKLDTSLYPWRSKLFIPWSFTVVETIIPKVFARDPKWRAINRGIPEPQMPEEAQQVGDINISTPAQSEVVNKLLTYQWSRLGMRTIMYDYIKDSLMYSKGIIKVGWKFKTKVTTIEEPVVDENDKITFKTVTKSEVEHDDPRVEVCDPFDIYIDPDSMSLKEASFVIHRKTIPLEELKNNPNYKNTEKIEDTSFDKTNSLYLNRNNTTPNQDKYKELVEVLEYWEPDRLIVVANKKVVLRDSPNPYNHKKLPFVELDDYRDPHKLYGQSELSVIDPLQREINAIRNQRRDYDNLALNPVIRMVPGTLRNPNSAVMSPGNVWMVSDLQSMDVFTLPQLQGTARDIEQQTAQDIKMSVAIDEIGIGLLPDNPQRRSATEVVTAQSMAGKRFAIKIALLEEAVKEIGQQIFALNQQFLDQERVIQIVGEEKAQEWIKLSPEDIRGDYFIDIETGSMLPKDEIAQRQEAIQLLQYITPIVGPIIQSNPNVVMPILRMVLDTFELPGKDEIYAELSNALGVAQQAQQQQAAQQAQMMQAQQAQAEATAMAQTQQAIQTPETLQGTRADNELATLIGNQ